MQINDKLLQKLEKLSYLKVDDDKREEIISQLSEIVDFVDNLSELDTNSVDEAFAMSDMPTPLREDVTKCNRKINDAILSHAPNSVDNFFVVPKIIE